MFGMNGDRSMGLITEKIDALVEKREKVQKMGGAKGVEAALISRELFRIRALRRDQIRNDHQKERQGSPHGNEDQNRQIFQQEFVHRSPYLPPKIYPNVGLTKRKTILPALWQTQATLPPCGR